MGRHFARFWGIALAAVLFTPVAAGAMVGGEVDQPNPHSNVGFVVEYDGTTPADVCTGTLISETVVVTAAHCLADRLAYGVSFEPTIDFSVDERFIAVLEYRINEDYDVAVLLLGEDATVIYPDIDPAGLPGEGDLDAFGKGDPFTHVGYGVDRARRRGDPFPTEFTRRTLTAPLTKLTDTQLYTHSRDGSLCTGDSGGPVFSKDGVIMALGNNVSGNCRGSNFGPRLDIEPVQSFLEPYVG